MKELFIVKHLKNVYKITSNDAVFLQILSILYKDINKETTPSGSIIKNISVTKRSEKMYAVIWNEKEIQTTTPLQIVQNIFFEDADFENNIFPLHAGAVEAGGVAHLFLASTGGGKTTLITYLSNLGYSYISDDCTLIDNNNYMTLPCLEAIRLRNTSLPVLKRYGVEPAGAEVTCEGFHRVVLMPKQITTSPLSIKNIFFINRCDAPNACTDIPISCAVETLLQNLISPKALTRANFICAASLASKCKKLTYSDMSYVDKILKEEQQ